MRSLRQKELLIRAKQVPLAEQKEQRLIMLAYEAGIGAEKAYKAAVSVGRKDRGKGVSFG
jgi:hypothetical protein